MNSIDGDKKLDYISKKIYNNEVLTKHDILTLVFLPIMNSTKNKTDRIVEAITLSKSINDKENQNNSLALLYAFAEKFVNNDNMNKVKEVFQMTELGKLLKQEGIEEGIERGRKEGLRDGLVKTSIKLLTKKFGILPDDIKNKIENSDTTVLEIIVDGILDFEKLEDIFKYLK